jgi:hypothetical protein
MANLIKKEAVSFTLRAARRPAHGAAKLDNRQHER